MLKSIIITAAHNKNKKISILFTLYNIIRQGYMAVSLPAPLP